MQPLEEIYKESVLYISDVAILWSFGGPLFLITYRSVGKRGNTCTIACQCILKCKILVLVKALLMFRALSPHECMLLDVIPSPTVLPLTVAQIPITSVNYHLINGRHKLYI
jgi:hypothetical protein